MNAIEMVQRLHRHRAWVNRNLMDAATRLTDEQLKAAFPIGQGSIWKSLLHLYGGRVRLVRGPAGERERRGPR